MEQPRSRPLGYDAIKSLLKSMSVEKRQELCRCIPELRTANAVVPYRIENLSLGDDYIAINRKLWGFKKVETSDGNEDSENKVIVYFKIRRSRDRNRFQQPNQSPEDRFRKPIRCHRLSKSPEDAYNQLFDTYLRNGTVVDKLELRSALEWLDKKNCGNWKIGVSSIEMACCADTTTSYERISRFIDFEQLTNMEFHLSMLSVKLLEKPEVINCKKLVLNTSGLDRETHLFENHLIHLRNEHLVVIHGLYNAIEPLVKDSSSVTYSIEEMDNLNLSRSRPLSYDALKSVLKSMSVEKRKLWVFGKSNSDDGDSNQTTISIVDVDTDQRSPDFTVNKSPANFSNVSCHEGRSKISLQFLLGVWETVKWNISRLITTNKITRSLDEFDAFIRFVNLDKLERISLTLYNKSHEHGGRFGVLEKPAIINCKNLDLTVVLSVPESPINYLTGLRNQSLVLKDNNFNVDDLLMLIENWKTSDRTIGTGFYLYPYNNDTNDMISSLNLEDTFPVQIERLAESPRDSTTMQGIGIKMDNNRDLVLYHGKHLIGSWYNQSLKMKVIASGSKKNRDSELHVSA
ncbi:hypothetical protein GCK72_007918 [Caenorhabditis remanei]|uniref:Uncharacterized protein n=1 Tax=Caenorhabditis remanei TaxID=31234 RepID=A0A6A5HJB5_CAERE|nr:hypothetical protein GCK72_007918 [Caenorhabditis remanei]KAF1767958.1 hypothetical protein GCK72_007918 [Caenorhabditis remanei]